MKATIAKNEAVGKAFTVHYQHNDSGKWSHIQWRVRDDSEKWSHERHETQLDAIKWYYYSLCGWVVMKDCRVGSNGIQVNRQSKAALDDDSFGDD